MVENGELIGGPTTRTQKKKDEVLIADIIKTTQDVVILDMICSGRSIHDTADELEITPTQVRGLLSEMLETYHDAVADHVEMVYYVNHLRLEHLYARAMDAAFSTINKQGILLEGNRQWAQLALNIIKEQNRMAEVHGTKDRSLKKEDSLLDRANIHIHQPTIIAKDDMYALAQKQLGDSFMERHGHRIGDKQVDELTSEDLITMQLENPDQDSSFPDVSELLVDKVASISDKIQDLEEKLNLSGATHGDKG